MGWSSCDSDEVEGWNWLQVSGGMALVTADGLGSWLPQPSPAHVLPCALVPHASPMRMSIFLPW